MNNMTKYLIFFLIFAILILLIFVFLPSLGNHQISPSPLPVITAPSATPASSAQVISPKTATSPADQINIQAQADQNFAAKTKEINTLYPWLNKLPIQSQNYFFYFDINEKQFIGRLYPQTSSSVPVNQQVNNFESEIMSKLQSLIPDYTKYNIRWDIKPE